MKEKIRILAPLVFIVGVVSCGRNPNDIRLNRETYSEDIKTATLFEEAVAPLKLKQLDDKYEEGVFKIPNQGTVTAKTNLNLTSDKIYIYYHEKTPEGNNASIPDILIDRKDVNKTFSSEITCSWDLNANYLKIDDHKKAVLYALLDTQQDQCWLCVSPLDGSAKYRRHINYQVYKTFSNFVFNLITHELTYELPDIPTQNSVPSESRAGFDISGFAGFEYSPENRGWYSGLNILSPMSILTYPAYQISPEEYYTVSTALDLMRIFLEPLGISHNFKASMDTSQNAYCEEIGLGDLYLSDFKDFYDSDSIQLLLTYLLTQGYITKLDKSDGTINLDFFLNYKNNFIHQEEFIANLKDINLDLLLDYTPVPLELDNLTQAYETGGYTFQSDIKKTNLNLTANQEMVETSTVDQVNLNDFPISG